MTLEIHKKHPADAIVIQRFETGACRVSVSRQSAYFSVTKKYGNHKTMYDNVNAAFRGMKDLQDRIPEMQVLPIWLHCQRNNWVEVTDEDELLMYLLSIS